MSTWVVTTETNDYNQHGKYFVAAYSAKPTEEQLRKLLCTYYAEMKPYNITHHLLVNGGGRISLEDDWYFLNEVEDGELLA